jgi:hypothetical protein
VHCVAFGYSEAFTWILVREREREMRSLYKDTIYVFLGFFHHLRSGKLGSDIF